MNLIGTTSINPFIFYSGKIAGYCTWILYVLSLVNVVNISMHSFDIVHYISYAVCLLGCIFTILSLVNLGNSMRLGLPDEQTLLKMNGIYRISRNPMYIGFNLFTLASMLSTLHPLVIIGGMYSMVVYHYIIRAEEVFLAKRFGTAYIEYKNKVRRYV